MEVPNVIAAAVILFVARMSVSFCIIVTRDSCSPGYCPRAGRLSAMTQGCETLARVLRIPPVINCPKWYVRMFVFDSITHPQHFNSLAPVLRVDFACLVISKGCPTCMCTTHRTCTAQGHDYVGF